MWIWILSSRVVAQVITERISEELIHSTRNKTPCQIAYK